MKQRMSPAVFEGVAQELKKVTWPTRKEALHLTLIVVILSFLLGAYIGIFDILFAKVLSLLLTFK